MMESENFSLSWPLYSFVMNSSIHQFQPYGCEFVSSSFATAEDSSEMSSISHLSNNMNYSSGEIFPYPVTDIQFQATIPLMEDFQVPLDLEEFGLIDSMLTDDGIEDLYKYYLDDSEESFPLQQPALTTSQSQDVWSRSPTPSLISSEVLQSSLTMPSPASAAIETDYHQLSLFHLLKAYGEATENNQTELGEVILRCVGEKASPIGETCERIASNLAQHVRNHQSDNYLMQESSKNFEAAFGAFYQMFTYGRFAHFAANSAILEAMPNDADTLHVVDFDIGGGIQWPPLIEALAWQQKTLRLTSIKWGEVEEDDDDFALSPWRFEDTRRRISEHTMSFGLNLEVEEMGIEDLVNELKKMKKTREWLAFNCMVGLPHMGKTKSRKLVNEFLNVAKQLLGKNSTINRGIITFGDGDACGKLKDCSGFGAFFDGHLMHYQAVLESMEQNFAKHLVQARMAMESLFVGPNICGKAWFQKWKEINETSQFQAAGTGLEGLRVSKERLIEAKQIARERDISYHEVSAGGSSGNELAFEWRGIALVTVSSWIN